MEITYSNIYIYNTILSTYADVSLSHLYVYVHTQTVAPFVVASPGGSVYASKPNLFAADPVHYTRAAVASIGILDYTHGTLSHAIQVGCSVIMIGSEIRYILAHESKKHLIET